MTNQELQKKIRDLGTWYQKINIEGIITSSKGNPYSSMEEAESTWKKINSCISDNYNSLKILDLGCNAGYYSVMAAKKGASVIGIERNEGWFKQSLFLKDYYENLWKTKLDIQYIHKEILDVDYSKFGKFDYIFAFAILYHIGKQFGKGSPKMMKEQNRVIKYLSTITNNFIVRARGGTYSSPQYYNKIFKSLNFNPIKIIPEGKRTLILYKKTKKIGESL
jgi:2-polyprenyl-3-methyl-5-hydroxy-6-metoxy-1,4-benzoquinol methylase